MVHSLDRSRPNENKVTQKVYKYPLRAIKETV